MRKDGIEFSFTWIFAMIVGMTILFLAIYAATRITQTQETVIDASTAKEIGILLSPLETGFESAKTTSLILPKETRIYNKCNNNGNFGRQVISLSQKSFNKWTDTDIDVGFSNKYIFSDGFVEGKKFYIFSKPFEFPFKVSDVIYVTSSDKTYCFDDAPEDIRDELSSLGQENIYLENCPEESIKVCFSGSCDVYVDYSSKYVEKENEKMYFSGDSMMYAAIFSEPEIYECQLKRLMQREVQLIEIYNGKAEIVSAKGCNSDVKNELSILSGMISDIKGSENINTAVIGTVDDIKNKNEISRCRLW
ncbi:MAG: hypothetical protein AABX93_01445 [Nanoarchaeota archaeon]